MFALPQVVGAAQVGQGAVGTEVQTQVRPPRGPQFEAAGQRPHRAPATGLQGRPQTDVRPAGVRPAGVPRLGGHALPRTTATGQCAWCSSAWLTEPRSSPEKPPRPLAPTTIS